jgi:3-hydroxyisobutyrate dehydrogenase
MTSDVLGSAKPLAGEAEIGWVGAGKMGNPMIRNLLASGHRVRVSEPNELQLAPLVAAGAEPAGLSDHAGSRIVFASLPNDAVVLEVVKGAPNQIGLAETLSAGAVFVEMSTVSPDCSMDVAKALSERGILYLRAPLSGSTTLAEQARLTVLASGDEAGWTMALPYLRLMSLRQFYLGPGEEARFMKLVLNTLVGASSAILSEALALGASGGLSPANMMEVIGESAVASPLFAYKTRAVVEGDYAPAFTIEQMIKDFTLISEAGRARDVPLFTTSLILELYRAAANAGLKQQDFFALVKWYSQMSSR